MARQDTSRRSDRNQRGGHDQMEKQYEERVIHIDRVARVVKGGRRFRFRALVVVGDMKGKVGIGVSKGVDVTSAVSKATDVAKKNFINIPIYKDTLPHETTAKVGGANILIKPAKLGSGLIAGGVVRTVLEVGGIKNAVSKSMGSSNRVNTAYATVEALKSLVAQKQWVTYKQNNSKQTAPEQATTNHNQANLAKEEIKAPKTAENKKSIETIPAEKKATLKKATTPKTEVK